MNPSIQIITDLKYLEGTAYIEILPGLYEDECWNEGSLFLDEESFGFLERIIGRNVPDYNHYAFMEVEKGVWEKTITELASLQTQVRHAKATADFAENVLFYFKNTEADFQEEFEINCKQLEGMISEFSEWISSKLEKEEVITVLGL
jgi:hypothetical protein